MSDLYSEIMGQPTISIANGTKAASGDNELIAAPSLGRLALFYVKLQNESATETTVQIKYGSTVVERVLLPAKGDCFIREYEPPRLLPEVTALNISLSGANSHGYTVEYITV